MNGHEPELKVTNGYERELGAINANLKSIMVTLSKLSTDMDRVRDQGCTMGWQLRREVDELKTRPQRNVDYLSRIVAIISTIFGSFLALKVWLLER